MWRRCGGAGGVLNGFGGTRPGVAFPVGQTLGQTARFPANCAGNLVSVAEAPPGGVSAVGKPGTANQFQRRELVAVPVLRRTHGSGIFERPGFAAYRGPVPP